MDPTEIPTRFPGIAFRLVAFAIAVMAGCTRADGERPEAAETVSDARLLKQLLDEVSTLPLTDRIGTRVRTTCASARRLARVTVVCPNLVPSAPLLNDRDAAQAMVSSRSDYELSFTAERNGRLLHWIVGGGKNSDVRRFVLGDETNEVKGLPTLIDTRAVHDRRVAVYRFPPHPAGGPNGGHIGAFVGVRGQLIFATVHGYSHEDAAIAMVVAMADQLD